MTIRSPTQSPDERETLTIAQLADLLGISRTVCYELAQRDELPIPAFKVGRQYRFSRRAFDALMNQQHPESVHTA